MKLYRLLFTIVIPHLILGSSCYAGVTTMTATNGTSPQNRTIAIATADSITLKTTTQNGSVAVTYDYSSSPGVSGPTSATATPGSPAVSLFTFSSTAAGQSNTINVSTTQSGATNSQGAACTPGTSSPTYTVVIPKIVIGNITNVPSYATYQRVPIYGGSSPIQGTLAVTISPPSIAFPTGTTIQFTIKNTGGNGLAGFDNSSASINLNDSGSLNIRGTANSDTADNMEIDAFLNGNSNDQLSDNIKSILLFTVSTWPNDCFLNYDSNQTLPIGAAVGFRVDVTLQSESGDINDLTNCILQEALSFNSYSAPPFQPSYTMRGIAVAYNTGGSGVYPPAGLMLPPPPGMYIKDIHDFPSYGLSYVSTTQTFTGSQQYQFQDAVLGTSYMPVIDGAWTIETILEPIDTANGHLTEKATSVSTGQVFSAGPVNLLY